MDQKQLCWIPMKIYSQYQNMTQGVWSEIFLNKQRHTDLIMNLIEKDSKQHFDKNRENFAVFVYCIFDMECSIPYTS